jgi:hypothetical protein
MSGVHLLVPDVLREIMLWLPSDIDQKFRVAQVSRYWRDTALHSPVFWSSFLGRTNQLYINRIPIVLERSGTTTMLHVELRLIITPDTDWPTKALAALVPYVARIESLDVEYSQYSTYPLSPPTFQVLLRSNLEFPALQTLRLKGPHRHLIPRLLLKTPRLRILDLEYFDPEDLDTLLPLSLENIRLHQVDVEGVETLFHILARCPRMWRVVLQPRNRRNEPEDEVFPASQLIRAGSAQAGSGVDEQRRRGSHTQHLLFRCCSSHVGRVGRSV